MNKVLRRSKEPLPAYSARPMAVFCTGGVMGNLLRIQLFMRKASSSMLLRYLAAVMFLVLVIPMITPAAEMEDSVLPFVFEKQNYGFALPDESPHLEKLNQALLSARENPEWSVELVKYIGKE